MALSRAEKERRVQDLTHALKESTAATVFSFRTLTVADSTMLRANLRKMGGRLRVIKKRLFRRVAADVGMPADSLKSMEGSVAIAWAPDEIAPAKVVHAFVREREHVKIEGGLLHGTVLTGEDVQRLATLPTVPELRGQLVSVLAGPVRGLAGVFASVVRGFPAVLQAVADKRGGASS